MARATVLAADLGGTKCRFGLVADDLSVVEAVEVATTMDRVAFLAALYEAFDRLAQPRDGYLAPTAIGLGVAAVVLSDGETLTGGPNLPLDGMPLGADLRARYGLPVTILNDGRASAWGEFLRGEAEGCDPLLVLFFGTGIGIGMIVDGHPYAGASNAAGEVGHAIHEFGGRRCACGRSGCYEAYCGGGPITRRAGEELGTPEGGGRWTVGGLVAAAAAGSAGAAAILSDAERAACSLVASLCTLLNPAAVVLGGGVLKGWPDLGVRVEAFARAWCTPNVERHLRFVPSTGGSDAILWGVAKATGALQPTE